MRTLVLVVTVFASPALAQVADVGATDVRPTIDRGLAFLVKDAQAWKDEHNCVTCHHAALVVWAMREAGRQGHSVDAPMLSELTTWLTSTGNGKTSLPRPEGIPKALNVKPIWFALGLGANPKPDKTSQEGLLRLARTTVEDQMENGSWAAWPDTRPPIFGDSNDSMTGLATLALMSVADRDEASKSARDKGMAWLAATKPDGDAQSLAIRLVLWRRMNRPETEWSPLAAQIRQSQNADGGWSQAAGMASDAWATGQALYALAHADFKPSEPTMARAHMFLVRTQRDDGSWAMTSRPTKPGGEGSDNLIPITGAGSAWAVIGLARSLEGD